MLRFLQGHAFAVLVLSLILLTSRGDLRLTPIQQAVAPYNHDLVTWEASHFMGKWWYKAWDVLPGGHRDREGRLASIRQFFDLVAQVNGQAAAVQRVASAPGHAEGELAAAEARLDELRARLRAEGTRVEEALESELSNALGAQGLKSRIGMVFPPVDFAFDPTPKLLIVSPRERIETKATALLRSDMTVEQMEGVEVQILRSEDLSALVDDTGGVATYPSVIPPSYDLRTTLQIIAHEWLHQFFFFRPLGRRYNSSPEMTTLNETAADMAGRELGDLAYEAITGQNPRSEPGAGPPAPPGVFDFSREMRVTRV
ncbi:MAG: hypothetical protein Q8O40_07565, partial [Chloroflexota bacterium]|nr:hypothetical protein [Chloroflexota bacterium]